MADVKISALPSSTTPLAGTEVLPIVQSSTTKQVSIANLTAGRAVSASSLTLTTPLSAANGGTGLSALGTNVATALGVNVGTAGAFVVNGGALGTPSSGTLTSCTGLPYNTGISGLGTGVATALGNATNAGNGLAVLNASGILNVAQGGTGSATFPAYYIVYGNGTNPFSTSVNLQFSAAGNLGIGLAPLASVGGNGVKLQIGDASSTTGSGLTIGATGTGDIQYSNATSGAGQYLGLLRFAMSTSLFSIWTNSAAKVSVDTNGNFLVGTTTSPTTGTRGITLTNGTAPTVTPTGTHTLYSSNLSASNTIPSVWTEGTGITGAGITNVTVTTKVAIRVNGTVYYLLATTNGT